MVLLVALMVVAYNYYSSDSLLNHVVQHLQMDFVAFEIDVVMMNLVISVAVPSVLVHHDFDCCCYYC